MTYLPGSPPGVYCGVLFLRWASRLDAFSVYPIRTSLPCYAVGTTTVAPVVRPFRSSRTRNSSSHDSYAHDGIEVPNLPVDVDSWGRSACYPRGSFYPLSDGFSTQYRRITKPDFRLCSICQSRSQAPFCLCALRMVSIHSEGTFGRLRYSFGGDRPSQTVHLTLSILWFHRAMLEFQ